MWLLSWWMLSSGCVSNSTLGDDGCPKMDLATFACPDGTCVADLDFCEELECSDDGREWCESTGQCVASAADCPSDTGDVRR